ncbi:39S ribosomal protein L23, mitochondrial [Octopus vulgaris]|uniref:39S ribosomal protein L23, mitochondrial n=2 Tax=Octopus TaxID=6643 RepID=A0AA36BQW9_OCTVU|nr:39S ribosomal protein L23, mitochondrial [Octopus sinensis]CAI9738252.1 39S ribosomal protein L23, mitochondrial [Octopus vulgaris]
MAHRLPLWKQSIPKFPVYWQGNPQRYLFLPQFWMKMVKPKGKVPPNRVHFIVHPQMSKIDIRNYLEKIYKVPVVSVSTRTHEGEVKKHPEKRYDAFREDAYKMAYVQLGGDHTFEFPDIFDGKKTNIEKEIEEFQNLKKKQSLDEQKNWSKLSLPPWFR